MMMPSTPENPISTKKFKEVDVAATEIAQLLGLDKAEVLRELRDKIRFVFSVNRTGNNKITKGFLVSVTPEQAEPPAASIEIQGQGRVQKTSYLFTVKAETIRVLNKAAVDPSNPPQSSSDAPMMEKTTIHFSSPILKSPPRTNGRELMGKPRSLGMGTASIPRSYKDVD